MVRAQRDEQPTEPGVARVLEVGWMGKGRRDAYISVRQHRRSM
jgi:hypothetical protein